jgi:trk system potassium uptake protein TrkA
MTTELQDKHLKAVIVGAGIIGKYIAKELLAKGHSVLLIDRDIDQNPIKNTKCDIAFVRGDACEVEFLEKLQLDRYDVVVTATDDDKVNLVVCLLAKTKFNIAKTIAKVNNAENLWLFDESWGVDFAVSSSSIIASFVEETFEVGKFVKLFDYTTSKAGLYEYTVDKNSKINGTLVEYLTPNKKMLLVGIVKDSQIIAPLPEHVIEEGDHLLFLIDKSFESKLNSLF